MIRIWPIFGLAGIFLTLAAAHAATNYVSTTGNDTNSGSFASPWRTIQKAANSLAPGDKALVRGGVYNERITINVSGSAAGYVMFQNYPGESPVIDGTGLTVPTSDTGLFLITDRSYIAIQGFEIRNYTTASKSATPAGIWVSGAAHHITLTSNSIHHIENTASGGNAFGVVFYGTASSAISNVVIVGNELFNLKTGTSESLTLNGNVSGFQVNSNHVHDVNNIGIDFIGGEGSAPTPALDAARNGVCRGNRVARARSSYGGGYAGGLYVDGGHDIVLENNVVTECDLGIEIGAENAGVFATNIIVRNNLVYNNDKVGIVFGGYAANTGRVRNCQFLNNTCYQNDTLHDGNGELWIQFAETNVIRNNILVCGSQNRLLTAVNGAVSNRLDYNLWFTSAATNSVVFTWNGIDRTGFTAYRTASGQDANSLLVDPRFVNPGQTNLHLATNSLAINAGDPAFQPASGETDCDGQPRVAGGRVDIGADELLPSPKTPPLLQLLLPTNGQVHVRLLGQPNGIYELQASPDLSLWLSIATNSPPDGVWDHSAAVTNLAQRFFRALATF